MNENFKKVSIYVTFFGPHFSVSICILGYLSCFLFMFLGFLILRNEIFQCHRQTPKSNDFIMKSEIKDHQRLCFF